MTKAPISLQDLRRSLYVKAKAEPSWRFWGLYVHVCKMETLRAAYAMAKQNDGAPGIDGVTFEAIEAHGVEALLEQLRDELTGRTYKPLPARKQEIPKDGGKVRVLSIPAIRDRVVQGALKLILEPVFEADFQPGSYGYRPKRTAHDAIKRVAEAIAQRKTRVLDFDLQAYFDNVRHDRLLEKVAQRVDDKDIMHLLKLMLKASGKKGVPQGGVISPLLSNLYLNEVDKMLERAREVTRNGKYTNVEYARFADDLVVLINAYKRHDWLIGAVNKRLREEFLYLNYGCGGELNYNGYCSPNASSALRPTHQVMHRRVGRAHLFERLLGRHRRGPSARPGAPCRIAARFLVTQASLSLRPRQHGEEARFAPTLRWRELDSNFPYAGAMNLVFAPFVSRSIVLVLSEAHPARRGIEESGRQREGACGWRLAEGFRDAVKAGSPHSAC